ncbi:MAG TPA: helix-turn-helix domain-containing protein, partial [Rariglobus sp.]
GSVFDGAFLVNRDDDTWHAWHDLKCLLDAALNLRQQENASLLPQVAPGHTQAAVEKHSPAFRRLLRWLDDACTAIDQDGATAGRKVMARAYAELRTGRSLMQATLTGHARIDRACQLLDLTRLRVKEIANPVGYADTYYFSRVFKKTTACSPKAYRARPKG